LQCIYLEPIKHESCPKDSWQERCATNALINKPPAHGQE